MVTPIETLLIVRFIQLPFTIVAVALIAHLNVQSKSSGILDEGVSDKYQVLLAIVSGAADAKLEQVVALL